MQLVITIQPDGNVQVSGPLEQRLVCLGAIELAKHAILNYKPEQQKKVLSGVALPAAVARGLRADNGEG